MDRPDLFALDRIPGREFAAIAAGPGIHVDGGADIGRAGDIADFAGLVVHAQMLVRDIEKMRQRRTGGRLPVLHARRAGRCR